MNKYKTQENSKIVKHDDEVGDKVMLNNNAAFKYDAPYKGPFEITQCWNNGTATLKCRLIKSYLIYIT